MNARGYYGGYRVAAEPPPIRQVLIDALDGLRREQQALAVKNREDEARLKIVFDLQKSYTFPIIDEFRRLQFEALQREGSTLAADIAATTKSLANVEGRIRDVSARIEKATGRPPPPPPVKPPPAKPPSRSPREEPRPSLREETPPPPPHEVMAEPARSPAKTTLYVAGAVVGVVVLGIAVSRMGS